MYTSEPLSNDTIPEKSRGVDEYDAIYLEVDVRDLNTKKIGCTLCMRLVLLINSLVPETRGFPGVTSSQ